MKPLYHLLALLVLPTNVCIIVTAVLTNEAGYATECT